ncbi:MAG: mechanosensitive ion channel family protein [Roseovarius sp.]|nr:mechanosensitive ion channel family protein [Roseovarius sp.]
MAFVATVSLYMGQGAFGALAGSGLVLAMLGFAIRNVVADTLRGSRWGSRPFRHRRWVDIDGLARGKVIEIGWRTTRILTRDATYMILPNSQIARQRITNYSAPKPQYRAQVSITLDHTMPIERARDDARAPWWREDDPVRSGARCAGAGLRGGRDHLCAALLAVAV